VDNKEFSKMLEKRTLQFAVCIIHLSTGLSNTPEGRVIKKSNYEMWDLGRGKLPRGQQGEEPG